MASDDLKQKLLALHATLASGERLDPELQALLRLLDADIRSRLEQDGLPSANGGSTPAMVIGQATPSPVPGSIPPSIHHRATAAPTSTTTTGDASAETSAKTLAKTSAKTSTTVPAPVNALPEPAGLSGRAQAISARFAAAHPHLEPVLRELSDTLQRIGI